MSKPTNVVVKCECCCSSLELEYDNELDPNTISCTLWVRHNAGRPLTWMERFRWIWRLLITGNPWSDHVLLNKKSARKVLNFLKNHV